MKKLFLASLLALPGLALYHGQASAYCFECFKPCVTIPLPRIPIVIPKISLPCANCCNQCPPPGGAPWYLQFPTADVGYDGRGAGFGLSGHAMAGGHGLHGGHGMHCGSCQAGCHAHGAKLKALHAKLRAHFTCQPQAVAATGGFSSAYQAPYTDPMGYAGGYPTNYPTAPAYWYGR